MSAWPVVVILVLAPLAVGGIVQLAAGTVSPVLVLSAVAGFGVAGAVHRIGKDRQHPRGKHVRDT